jgi:hypothetical protein
VRNRGQQALFAEFRGNFGVPNGKIGRLTKSVPDMTFFSVCPVGVLTDVQRVAFGWKGQAKMGL